MSLLLWAFAALILGLIPGLLLFPAAASPFMPGLWILNAPFARIFHTIAQVIRGRGVLVKRKDGTYEAGIYDPDAEQAVLSDTTLPMDSDRLRWALFGKRPLAVTWEPGTELHERMARADADADGLPIDMGAAHRYLRGTNDADAISRTKEAAEAKYGGGNDGLGELGAAAVIGGLAVLGALTTWLMLLL